MPIAELTSKSYAASQRTSIAADRATPLAGSALAEGQNTTHFSVVDSAGNAAAITTTINTGFGSGFVVAGTGFLLNNEMDDFTVQPGVVNAMGIKQEGMANTIEPGKRMLSSMTPTIVLDPAGTVVDRARLSRRRHDHLVGDGGDLERGGPEDDARPGRRRATHPSQRIAG